MHSEVEHSELAQLTPGELPETQGERHLFATIENVHEYFDNFDRWDSHSLILRMDLDRTYAVDVALLEQSEMEQSEITDRRSQ